MSTQIEQIAERVRGLRESLNLTHDEIAIKCGITTERYKGYESGQIDIPLSFICELAQKMNIETAALIAGDEPRSTSFWVTRKGSGPSVARNNTFKYQTLTQGFKASNAKIFEVTINHNDNNFQLNTHSGHEFNYILSGKMRFKIGENEMELSAGDSVYFDAMIPHAMKAASEEEVRFLVCIV